ncbi:hypothetical protein FHX74_003714 [Friedmanniella endophytica]|uniref:Uncharacterized protein n=1 Tax=Microlunatus kandeliicorticis TaxID=1759536 RepID=A0A7W3IVJ7_9ACTN|nr:hypothetical protein [Microlunatus kandeliicorticis]MBA8796073.1 hypothetical protein [Microlunatus kandeliicorticis]
MTTADTSRAAHLVGSLPGATAAEAMATALDVLGPHLRSIPDGETGERRNWVISIVESLRDHPDLELVRQGHWTDYDDLPRLRVRPGHRLYGANLDFGHVAAVRDSYPALEELRTQHGRPDLAFQSGVPGDFDLAMFTLGPVGALTNRRPFTEATLTEIRGVAAATRPDTVFQIEVPVELVLLTKLPPRARPAAAARFGAVIAGLAQASPAGTRFGLHLCLGDMNNRPFGTMGDVSPLVLLSNAVTRRWPDGRPLEYVHAPFAAADQPAPVGAGHEAYYAPLRDLRLPSGTRFVAGFAHESQDLADQLRIRTLVDELVGRPVDVAAACGLGRRSVEDGRRVLERTAELVTA